MTLTKLHRRLVLAAPAALLASHSHAAERTILAATPISRLDLPWWRARHEAKLKELARTKPDLLWLGDSITQNWEKTGPQPWVDFQPAWQQFYSGRNAINLGFKGDTTASLLWRIRNGEVAGISPKAAIVLIGANNLGRVHWSAEDTVAGIDTIIRDLRQRLPTTKLLLLGVLPSERSAWVTETTERINRELARRYKDSRDVAFLDLSALFMKNGMVNRDLYYDPKLMPPEPTLHPTAQGQVLIAKAIEPVLSAMMGGGPHP